MNPLLGIFLENLIRHGNLEVETGDGAKRAFGDGSGAPIAIRLADGAAERALMFDPEMALGELYMDGRLDLRSTRGDLYDVRVRSARPTHSAIVTLD